MRMVSSGMRDEGYVYVNIDDAWEGERDAQGIIHPNSKFPDMKALADYVHSKGLKLGLYSSPGPKTCAKFEGSYGHEQQDADTYAAWGIDYLKYDLCGLRDVMRDQSNGDPTIASKIMRDAYEKMHQALLQTHRPIVYSFCEYGWDSVWVWGPSAGANLWRTTGDVKDTYDRMSVIGFSQAGLAKYATQGTLERPRHAGDRQWRHDSRRIPYPDEPVVSAGGTLAGRANVGYYTALLDHLVKPGGQVHSFEPGAGTFARLTETKTLLHLDQAVLHRQAVSDAVGHIDFWVSTTGFDGQQGTVRHHGLAEDVRCDRVEAAIRTEPGAQEHRRNSRFPRAFLRPTSLWP